MSILKSYSILTVSALLLAGSGAFAQTPVITDQAQSQTVSDEAVNTIWKPSLVKDGVYDKVPHINRVLAWQTVRENDILWKKRVWREIDTREKQNMAFRYPGDESTGGGYFIEILLDAVKKGKAKAYSNYDDKFTSSLTREQIQEMLVGKPDTIEQVDPISGEVKLVIRNREFDPDIVTKYRIKEDWIFDRNLGRMVVRIIGIAPIVDRFDDDGNYKGSQPLFWLYYPEAREVLAQYEVFNPENDVARMSWEEYFEGRFFSSKVTKVSNPFDKTFNQQGKEGLEALYEAQRTNEMIFNKEHDMWVY